MRNIVVCCDGTWNTADQESDGRPSPTNVVKLYNALEHSDDQPTYYHPGVGTGSGFWDKKLGGGLGVGLDHHIKSAYRWLAETFRADDRIFIFGFSRGAFTARSLGGLIIEQGLLNLKAVKHDPDQTWQRVDDVYAAYRAREEFENPKGYEFHNAEGGANPAGQTEIYFMGVWDTVGALGIPESLSLLDFLDDPAKFRFHDTKLSTVIQHARHAVALDEDRRTFEPTLWKNADEHPDAKQVWFPGVHADVGGGYFETGLSDGALLWMLDEAQECGLKIHPKVRDQISPDPQGIVHDSCTGPFKELDTRPRPAPLITDTDVPYLHPSVRERHRVPLLREGRYWPTQTLDVGNTFNREIFAAEPWNQTGLFRKAGSSYDFVSEGQWLDGEEKFSPDGKGDHAIHLGDIKHFLGTALDHVAEEAHKLLGDKGPGSFGTKRFQAAEWFCLIGFASNNRGRNEHGLPTGQMFRIGSKATFVPEQDGYLYCFANDAWHAYFNNKGSVTLKITRTK